MFPTVVEEETVMFGPEVGPRTAVSAATGTVLFCQFAAVAQSIVDGTVSQVELPANAGVTTQAKANGTANPAKLKMRTTPPLQ